MRKIEIEVVKRIIKKITRKLGFEISRYQPNSHGPECVSLVTNKPLRGNALISYRIEPFLARSGEPIPNSHTNYWASLEIARVFLNFGYNVDVISFQNQNFIPQKEYSVILDARHNLERLTPFLGENCTKIMWLDTAHILFHNAAEAQRLLSLQQRRGVTLQPRRFEMPNLGIEYADYAITTGNEFSIGTYQYAKKSIYRVPIPAAISCPWPSEKDFEAVRKHFLWFNSSGMVHKGLDLVVEAFSGLPDNHLTICGPVNDEKDFERAFYKELYRTSNIHTIGWVNVNSSEFIEIANHCIGIILVSCSEGASASTINCMHAGLIPVVSRESSIDIDPDFGLTLSNCSVEEIRNSIRMVSNLPTDKLREMARRTWEFARANHTRERFTEEFRKIITNIIDDHRNRKITDIKS